MIDCKNILGCNVVQQVCVLRLLSDHFNVYYADESKNKMLMHYGIPTTSILQLHSVLSIYIFNTAYYLYSNIQQQS